MTVFLVLLGALGAFIASLRWLDPRRRARRALEGATEKRLGALGEGDRVRIRGVARRGPERRISVTGRECIGYRAVVDAAIHTDWRTVLEVDDCAPFELHADGFAARVEGPFLVGLERDDGGGDDLELSPALLEGLERHGVSRVDDLGRRRIFRVFEARLEEGDSIDVLGRAELAVDQRGERESPRGPPILRLISGTDGEPTVLADVEVMERSS
jgi:hypothetical protein